MRTYIPVWKRRKDAEEKAKHANHREIKGTTINYPVSRKSKHNPDGKPKPKPRALILQELKLLDGLPDSTAQKRKLIVETNPFHYSLGKSRAVWKTYQTYAQNMGLLEDD